MEAISHIYLVGCSYMYSYAASKPENILREKFGSEVVNLSWGGSGYDYHERTLFSRLLDDKPQRALVIFGLSYWHRFELAYRRGFNQSIEWMQFNPGVIMHSHEYGNYFKHLKDYPDKTFEYKAANADGHVEEILRRLLMLAAFLKSNNHQYIMFNQIDDAYPKFLQKNIEYQKQFTCDKGFVNLHSFSMLNYLRDAGVEYDDQNHPLPNAHLCVTMSKFLIDWYENEITSSK